MDALRTADEIRDVNTRYHDVAADSYDSKWGIDFGEIGQGQVLGKLRKLLGPELDDGYDRSLEIGAGTGYFSLNLLQAGVVGEATCTDISPGMVAMLARNAQRLGLNVHGHRRRLGEDVAGHARQDHHASDHDPGRHRDHEDAKTTQSLYNRTHYSAP